MAASEYLARGAERIQNQIETEGRKDPHPYHILGSQMLAYIKRWVPREEKAKQFRELHARVAEGAKKNPLDRQLQDLVDSIKKPELSTVVG